jgi:hypothetical protein
VFGRRWGTVLGGDGMGKSGRVLARAWNRAIVLVLVLALFPGVVTAGSGGASGDGLILELAWETQAGAGPGAVGVNPNPEGAPPEGPQALAVNEAGDLFVADSVGRQIVVSGSGLVRTIATPYIHYARDLAVTGGRIYVLDVSDKVFVLLENGRLDKVVSLPAGMTHLNVLRLVPAQDRPGEVLLWCSNYIQFSLADLPAQVDPALWGKAGLALAGVGASTVHSGGRGPRDESARSLVLNDQNELQLIDGRRRPVSSILPIGGAIGSARQVAVDRAGWVYVLVEELGAPNPGVQVELSLRAYNPAGNMVRAMRLPTEDMAAIPWQPVAVTPAGEVYVLVPGRTMVSVWKAVPGQRYASRLTHVSGTQSGAGDGSLSGTDATGAGTGVGILAIYYGKFKGYPIPQTRSGVRTRAMQMVDYTWTWHTTYDYLATGQSRATMGATAPDHFATLVEGSTVHGIPYCWGGWDSLWTYSDNWQWTSFGGALTKYYPNKGPLVGNINSAAWISGTAGIDCSGFVAAASDAYYCGLVGSDYCYKPGCGTLQTNGKTVSNVVSPPTTPVSPNYAYFSGMQPMDFFVNSSHVLYYKYRLIDGSGMATIESTTTGTEDGAKTYSRVWSDLRNYSCRSWWDKMTGDDFNVAFTTKTGRTAIQGTQIYYTFQAVSSSSTITVTASYGDPDLYAYNSSYGFINKSTLPGSDTLTITTTAGAWYYIKIHAWTDCIYTITW